MSTLSLCLSVLFFVCSVIAADNVVQVRKVSDSELHPESLELQIQMPDDDETAVLELKREDKFNKMPLTISENKRQSRMSSNMLDLNSFGHYRNVKKRAAFAVRRNADGSAEFSGHFKHKRHVYSVSKVDNKYLVKKAEEYPGLNDFEEEDDESDIELSKRQMEKGATTNTVELRLLLDNTVYDFFKNRQKSEREALAELQFYYSYVLNAMDVVYRNIKSISISVECIDVFIAKTESDAHWMKGVYGGDASAILQNLQDWSPKSTVKADHYMAFTRIDIQGDGNNGVVGMAYMGGACGALGVSINEDNGLNVWSTAAHELGHNLGSPHDDGTSCKDQRYVMSAIDTKYTKQNLGDAYQFSSCSINSISKYINGLNPNCLQKDDGTRSRAYITSAHPGSRWTADEICKLFHPSSAGHYKLPGTSDDSVCYDMWCLNAAKTSARGIKQAPVGMSCGKGKICSFNAKCESDSGLSGSGAVVPTPPRTTPRTTRRPTPRTTPRTTRRTPPKARPTNKPSYTQPPYRPEPTLNSNCEALEAEDVICTNYYELLGYNVESYRELACDYAINNCCLLYAYYCQENAGEGESTDCVDGRDDLERFVCEGKNSLLAQVSDMNDLICPSVVKYNCCKTKKQYCPNY